MRSLVKDGLDLSGLFLPVARHRAADQRRLAQLLLSPASGTDASASKQRPLRTCSAVASGVRAFGTTVQTRHPGRCEYGNGERDERQYPQQRRTAGEGGESGEDSECGGRDERRKSHNRNVARLPLSPESGDAAPASKRHLEGLPWDNLRVVRFFVHAVAAYVVFFLAALFLLYGTGLASWEGSGGPLDGFAEDQEWVVYLVGMILAIAVAWRLDRRHARPR
jgi:hypothetical protein